MLKLKFKRASKPDLEGILYIMQKVGYLNFRFPNQSIERVRKQIESELYNRTFLICYIKCLSGQNCNNFKRIIGYSIFGPAEKFLQCPIKVKKLGFVFSLGIGIDPHYHRTGIGKKLVNYSKNEAIKDGFQGVYGDAASNNKPSIQFQKSIGFKKIAEYSDPKRPKGVKNILFFKEFKKIEKYGPKEN